MHAMARLERLDTRNRRGAPRRQLSLGSVVAATGDEAIIHDLSATGMLVETKADLATFEQLQLDLPEVGKIVATVMWNSGQYFGCEFQTPIPKGAISAALLRSPFSEQASVADEADVLEEADDRFTFKTRLRVVVVASLVLWALILFAFGVL